MDNFLFHLLKSYYLTNWKACLKSNYEKYDFYVDVKWLDDIICHVCQVNRCHILSSLGLGFGTLSHFPTSVLFVSTTGNGIETFASHEPHISLRIHWTLIVLIELAMLTIHCIYCVLWWWQFIANLLFLSCIMCFWFVASIVIIPCIFVFYYTCYIFFHCSSRCFAIVWRVMDQVKRLASTIQWKCNQICCFSLLTRAGVLQISQIFFLMLLA